MKREDLIEQGKMNEWVAFGGLSKELQELMKELWESEEIEYRGEINWRNKGKTVELYKTTIYRINPNYEEKQELEYDVYDVYVDENGDYSYINNSDCKHFLHSEIFTNRFAGLQFEGQKGKEWYMTMKGIDNLGFLYVNCNDTLTPATPTKIRIKRKERSNK